MKMTKIIVESIAQLLFTCLFVTLELAQTWEIETLGWTLQKINYNAMVQSFVNLHVTPPCHGDLKVNISS